MPWKAGTIVSERLMFVSRAVKTPKGGFAGLCREFGITPPTGYLWKKRAISSSDLFAAVLDHSRRPHHSPNRSSPELESRVVSWHEKTGWGAKKIQVLLAREGLEVKVLCVHRILKRHGLVEVKERQPKASRRFERSQPNELIQMDFKGDYPTYHGRCYPLSLQDDHSRFLLGLYPLANQQGSSVQRCLIHCFQNYGVPEALLLDHGNPWHSSSNSFGLTWLSVWLIKQGITLVYSGLRHPQTQGKVERMHRAIEDWLKHHGRPQTLSGFAKRLTEFRQSYNWERPHEGIGMALPADRYQASRKDYNPQPTEWEYPSGATIKRLDACGQLEWQGRRFVCEALAGERVQIEEIGDHLMIKYRHLYIRDIDLSRDRTLPPVRSQQRLLNH
jgi:transposase InsO family protein